jgi:hypothetical protein
MIVRDLGEKFERRDPADGSLLLTCGFYSTASSEKLDRGVSVVLFLGAGATDVREVGTCEAVYGRVLDLS